MSIVLGMQCLIIIVGFRNINGSLYTGYGVTGLGNRFSCRVRQLSKVVESQSQITKVNLRIF